MADQFPKEFINALNAILKHVNHNPYALTEAMKVSKQEGRMDAYYTFDAALAYLTYTKIVNEPDMEDPIQKLLAKMHSDLETLSSGTNDT
jgi:cob(I)alamin adenosyltransferase